MSDGTLGTRVDDDPSAVNAEGSHFDVLIIGTGLSGIGAACRLVRKRPRTTLAILEARNAIGGTWDLFRYPGIRLGLGYVDLRLWVPSMDRFDSDR